MNHTDTLGKRIQVCRKAAGLSQEALGEQLQVSRQAVSKWESDITVPELDTLIAMSRLFGVSIGALLGVEAASDSNEESNTGTAEDLSSCLTEKELAAVEAIAARYAQKAEQRPKWSNRNRGIVIAAACILVLAVGWYIQNKLETIDRRFIELQHEVDSIDRSVSAQIGSLTGQMENILSEQANILANSAVSFLDADILEETVTLQISVSPKEWTTTTTAVFTAFANGEQITSEPIDGAGGIFTLPGLTVPMSQEIALSVSLLDGDAARTEKLDTLRGYQPESFRPIVEHVFWGSTRYTDGTVILNNLKLWIQLPQNGQCVQITHGELQLYRNYADEPEQIVAIPMLLNTQAVQENRIHLDSIADEHKTSFTLDDHDTVLAVLMLTDTFDRTTYTIVDGFIRQGSAVNTMYDLRFQEWTPGTEIPDNPY